MSGRLCRTCGLTDIPYGALDAAGEPISWLDDDICSSCADDEADALQRDAARYRHLRSRRLKTVDLDGGLVCAGKPAEGLVLAGEELDRAVDREMGLETENGETLERQLARCLADAVDTPVMKVRDTLGGPEIELRFGAWLPEISERAAELLEEAGL